MSSLDTKKQITISYNFVEKQSMSRNLHLNYHYLEKREKDTQNLKKTINFHTLFFIYSMRTKESIRYYGEKTGDIKYLNEQDLLKGQGCCLQNWRTYCLACRLTPLNQHQDAKV